MNKVRERILKEVAEAKYQDYEKHKDLIQYKLKLKTLCLNFINRLIYYRQPQKP